MTDEQTLAILNQQYVDAFLHNDVEWYRENLTDDFICVESDGTLLEKPAFLEATAKPHSVARFNLVETRIRIFEDVALIHCKGEFATRDGRTGTSRYTDGYVKRDGRWRAISAHITHA